MKRILILFLTMLSLGSSIAQHKEIEIPEPSTSSWQAKHKACLIAAFSALAALSSLTGAGLGAYIMYRIKEKDIKKMKADLEEAKKAADEYLAMLTREEAGADEIKVLSTTSLLGLEDEDEPEELSVSRIKQMREKQQHEAPPVVATSY